MSDELKPGEIEIETGATADPPLVETPVAEETPAVEIAEPAAIVEEPKPKPTGMLAELIEERRLRKDAEKELRAVGPVLARLTPEMQEAITDGRIAVQPKATTADARKVQLKEIADELRLFQADGTTPDLDAAERVERVMRKQADAAAAPLKEALQQTQQVTLTVSARKNIDEAVRAAEANGVDGAFVREQFELFLQQPNGAGLLTQPEVAMKLWHAAVGEALVKGKGKLKGEATKEATPAALVSEPTGRRTTVTAVKLTPKMERVYKDAGLDPAKGYSAGREFTGRGIELE